MTRIRIIPAKHCTPTRLSFDPPDSTPAIVVGCVSAALLALLLDGVIHGVESGLRGRNRTLLTVMLGLLVTIAAAGLVSGIGRLVERSGPAVIRIGAKAFTEQYILSNLMGMMVERDTPWQAEIRQGLGSRVAFDALAGGELDVYVDYSGSIWATILKETFLTDDRRAMIESISRRLDDQYGVRVIGPIGFENAYCLAMRRAQADELGITSIGDLAGHDSELRLAADMEFLSRAEYRQLVARHDLAFAEVRTMDAVLMYSAVARGEVDVISAYTTEGRIAAYDLVVLDDEAGVFPPYDAIILISSAAAKRRPDLVRCLGKLVGKIDADRMRRANWAVDENHRPIEEVAHEVLEEIAR